MAAVGGREMSLRALLLGALLSAVLSAANAYLGLFAGMTVSASIPAAVISMGILRAFRGTLLENNIVQTAASAGESVAAGAIFTLPALILLGAWQRFDYLWTVVLVGAGGLLGVVFTIPLRRALIIEAALPFPEGVATALVLRAGHSDEERGGLRVMSWGALVGALVKLFESGFGWIRPSIEGGGVLFGRVFALATSTSPALLAVGYIVGLNVALLVVAGGVINWVFVLPFVTEPRVGEDILAAAARSWSTETRYLGVGAMTAGGLGAVIQLRSKLVMAVSELWTAVTGRQASSASGLERGVDLSGAWLACVLAVALAALGVAFALLLGQAWQAALLVGLVFSTGFLFCAVAGYMAGLVGSSNNPVSGVTIATVLITSLVLLALGAAALPLPGHRFAGPAMAILVGTAVCTAAAIGGDTMQDLKSGQLLAASPKKQQIAQLVGVVAASLVLSPVLQLLLDVHGFGLATPSHPHPLRAPQATLMAAVSSGVFGGDLPLGMVAGGVSISLCAFALDAFLARRRSAFRTPPLALAVGLYLPLEVSAPVALGGLVAGLVERRRRLRGQAESRDGLLLGAGLITGEALFGIGLAAIAGWRGTTESLKWGLEASGALSLACLLGVLWLFARSGRER